MFLNPDHEAVKGRPRFTTSNITSNFFFMHTEIRTPDVKLFLFIYDLSIGQLAMETRENESIERKCSISSREPKTNSIPCPGFFLLGLPRNTKRQHVSSSSYI